MQEELKNSVLLLVQTALSDSEELTRNAGTETQQAVADFANGDLTQAEFCESLRQIEYELRINVDKQLILAAAGAQKFCDGLKQLLLGQALKLIPV
jgi:uncharacterized membrane protein